MYLESLSGLGRNVISPCLCVELNVTSSIDCRNALNNNLFNHPKKICKS